MNADTGRVYELGADLVQSSYTSFAPGESVWPSELALAAEDLPRDRVLTADEMAAIRDAGPLVSVSQDVATQLRLGQRELDRRKRRRKASRQARKQNR